MSPAAPSASFAPAAARSRFSQADRRRQVPQLVGRASTFDVVASDATPGRDHDRAVVVLDIPAGALAEEGLFRLGTFGRGLCTGGRLTHRALGLVADIGELTAEATPLLLQQVGRLGMDVRDIGTDPHELLDGT